MSGHQPGRAVVGIHQLERLALQLGPRDRRILLDLARVRVLSGSQLTRLHFSTLSVHTRERLRRRVMQRLIDLGLVATLDRQIGGVRAGSMGLVYSLAAAGQRVLPLISGDETISTRIRARRPWTPGLIFLSHSLTVAELYVQLREAERSTDVELADFRTEPLSWLPNGLGGFVKADAYLLIRRDQVEDAWAIEVDRATESLSTLRRKLLAYVDFANAGQVGPDEVTPRVLVTVPTEKRLVATKALVTDLPEPATQLVSVVLFHLATRELLIVLRE